MGDPYIPSEPDLVRAKLEFAELTETDLVLDLGCGDGRVLIMAAEEYGASGIGVDIQEGVVEEAWTKIVDHDLEDMIEIRCEDFLNTDISQADLLVLYLTTRTLHALSDKLREAKPGARIVTHDFPLSGWSLSEQGSWTSESGHSKPLYLYLQS